MVRSENNIEVITDFLEACGPIRGIGEHVQPLLSKQKNLFLTKTDFALRFVKSLSQSLTTEESFGSAFEFIKGLLNGEHNSKKKIVYFKMLEGFIFSLKEYSISQKYVSETVVLVANSWGKFIE